MGHAIIAYTCAGLVLEELPPWLPHQLLMISNQAFYLRPQLAWPEEVQPDIEISPTSMYLFFDVLQTETHMFPLYLLQVASIIAEKEASSYPVFYRALLHLFLVG
jgi:hypothetical protein